MIDDFVKLLLASFLGESEHAVSHLDVRNYAKKKIVLLRLVE